MTHFAARPLWVAGLVVLVVCLVAPWISPLIVQWLLYGGVLAAIVFLAIPIIRRWRIPVVVALACALASLSFLIAQNRYLPTAAQVGNTLSLQVQVEPHSTDTVYLRVQGGDLPKGVGLVLYRTPSDNQYEPYEQITARFQLIAFENEGLSFLQSKASDVWFAVKLEGEVISRSTGKVPWTNVFYRIRRGAVANIQRVLSKSAAAVVSGICFGEDGELPLSAVNDFRTCGVTHLFAVSGLHMTVLAHGILFLLKKCRVPRVGQTVVAIAFLWMFMVIVGLSASVLRAGLLCTLVLLGNCLHRQADSRTALGLALLVLLLLGNPFAAYDVGLLLSFVSTYGLLMWAKPIRSMLLRIPYGWMGSKLGKVWGTIISGVAVTLAATFATAPILIIYFGKLSLVSVPVNVLVTLPAEGILILGCLASLIVPVIPFMGNALLLVCGVLAKYILWICNEVASIPFATVSLKTLPWLLWLVSFYVLIAIGWLLYRKRGALLGVAASVAILCVLLVVSRSFSKDRIVIQAIPSQTDVAAYVQCDSYRMLVLSASLADTLKTASTQLSEQGVARLDAVVFVGGKSSVVSAAPNLLENVMTQKTQCFYANVETPFIGVDLTNNPIVFGENGSLVYQNDFLQVTAGENRVVFAANTAQRETLPSDFKAAPLLLLAGKAEFMYGDVAELEQPLPTLVLEKGEVYRQRNP